jgi:hypothetical protein
MTFDEFRSYSKKLLAICEEIQDAKGKEYARADDAGDRFAHFKRLAAETKCTPLGVAYVLYRKQLDAVISYINSGGRVYSGEPIEMRFADLINYSLLMAGMAAEIEAAVEREEREGLNF